MPVLGRVGEKSTSSTTTTMTTHVSTEYSTLTDIERQWQQVSGFLETKGYVLRPRYRKNWRPSWELSQYQGRPPEDFEDHIRLPNEWSNGIDAIQTATGRRVWIKRTSSYHLQGSLLMLRKLSQRPQNDCVPTIIEHFHEEDHEDVHYVVMPFLRPFHDPPFRTVGDVVDFVSQVIDGLAFLHSKNYLTRHGDIAMQADGLFPLGFHPVKLNLDSTARFRAKRLPRWAADVKYYFTNPVADYASCPVSSGSLPQPPEVLHSKSAEETSRLCRYKIDIWFVGQLLKTQLLNVYSNVEFLNWTVAAMTDEDPGFRMSADNCRALWSSGIPEDLLSAGLGRRLRFRQETRLQSIALDVTFMLEVAIYAAEKFFIWLNDLHG